MGMNLFKTTPRTQTQRDRWLTLIDVVQNGTYTSALGIQEAMHDRGHFIARGTVEKDIRSCNIYKINGVYTLTPYTNQDVIEEILEARMRASVLSVFQQDDLVILNTQRGAGGWIASALREFDNDQIMSVNESENSVWVLASKGNGKRVYRTLNTIFERARTRL